MYKTRHALASLALLIAGAVAIGLQCGATEVRPGAPVVRGPVPQLPALKPLFDYPVRDASGPGGKSGVSSLTATTGAQMWGCATADIRLWRSTDLKHWLPVTSPSGDEAIWNVDRDGTW